MYSNMQTENNSEVNYFLQVDKRQNIYSEVCEILTEVSKYFFMQTLIFKLIEFRFNIQLSWSSWFFMHQTLSGAQIAFSNQIDLKCLNKTENFHSKPGIKECVQQSAFTRFLTACLNCCSMTTVHPVMK